MRRPSPQSSGQSRGQSISILSQHHQNNDLFSFATAPDTSCLQFPQTPFIDFADSADDADGWSTHLTYQQWPPPQPYVTPPDDPAVSAVNLDSFDANSFPLCPWDMGGTPSLDSSNHLSDAHAAASLLQPAAAATAPYQDQDPQPHPHARCSGTNSAKASPASDSTARIEKRKLNTLSARRYRQRRLDRMSELEAELREAQSERDALKVRVAELEGETKVLREMLRKDQ